jgi:hypothetical protein
VGDKLSDCCELVFSPLKLILNSCFPESGNNATMSVAVCCSEQSLKMAALNTGLIEKLTVSQQVKKFPEFYGNRMFIATVTTARHFSPLAPSRPTALKYLQSCRHTFI